MRALIFLISFTGLQGAYAQHDVLCPSDTLDVGDWIRHDRGSFSLLLPSRFSGPSGDSLDSDAGVWKSGPALISYDYGYYSNRLVPSDNYAFEDMSVCDAGCGRSPRVIAYRTTTGAVRLSAHWRSVDRDGFGDIHLTLGGTYPSGDDLSEALAVIRSVRFPDR